MPIDRSKIKWDDEPINPSKVNWGDGKFRFASKETEQAGVGAIGRAAQAVEDYFTKPVAPAPANVQAQGYDPLAAYAERTLGNVPKDVTNIAQGFTAPSLAATGSALYNQPIETLAGMGGAALEGAGQFISDPLGTFANNPVSTMFGLQGAQFLRAPTRLATNVLAERAYPLARRAISPTNRMLSDVFGAPEIQAALQEAPPGMTVPQALADVNAPRAQAVARQAMGIVPQETRATQLAQEEARRAQLSKISRTPEELRAAEEARGAAATQNYRQAFRQIAPDLPEEFLDKPSMKAAFKEADNIAAERGGEATPVEQMHNIKLALDKIVSKPEDYGLGGAQKAAIASTRQGFINELLSVPEYAKARADFAAQSVPINKMKVGQALLDAAMEPVTEGATRAGTFARAVEEAPKTIKKATGQEFFTKLEEVLSPDEMDIVNNVRDEFRRTKLADEQAKLGAKAAPEVEELASAKVTSAMNIPFLNRAWTIANTVVKRSLGKIDEKLATEIGLMMQDPAELNRAIAKAKRYEKDTAKTVGKLREKRQKMVGQLPKQALYGSVSFQNAMSPQNQNAMAR